MEYKSDELNMVLSNNLKDALNKGLLSDPRVIMMSMTAIPFGKAGFDNVTRVVLEVGPRVWDGVYRDDV